MMRMIEALPTHRGYGMLFDHGAPPYDRGPAACVTVDLPVDVARALDAWIASQPAPRPERPDAIVAGLRDWLTGLGHLPHVEQPEGRGAWH